MNLISYHVLQSLIESWPKEDHYFKPLASETIVHHLVTIALITSLVK